MGTKRVIMIGRHPDCDVTFPDDTVSRFHAELVLTEDGRVFLLDRNSTWGTHVHLGGRWKKLDRGDFVVPQMRLRIGQTETDVATIITIANAG